MGPTAWSQRAAGAAQAADSGPRAAVSSSPHAELVPGAHGLTRGWATGSSGLGLWF